MAAVLPEVRVTLPQALRSFCADPQYLRRGEVLLPAADVRTLLAQLAQHYPSVHVRVCDERGEPRPHINVFVNDDHIRARDGLDTPLAAGDRVMILPAVSGGE